MHGVPVQVRESTVNLSLFLKEIPGVNVSMSLLLNDGF